MNESEFNLPQTKVLDRLMWDKSLVLKWIVLDIGSVSEIGPASSITLCQVLKMLNAIFHYKNNIPLLKYVLN